MERVRSIAFALLAATAAGTAAAGRCLPQVTVRPVPVEVVEHLDRGIRELTELNQSSSLALTRDGLGLGSTVTQYRVTASLREDRRGCPSVQVDVGYPLIRVYVARELADNACALEHVRRHELEHVAINRRWLDVVPARIEARLAAEHAQLMSTAGRDARLQHVLTSALEELKKVQAHHDAFDSPEEYATNGTACGGHIQRVLDAYRAAP